MLPDGFEQRQLVDKDFKVGDGESQNEVANRMYNSLMELVNSDHNKIVVLSHATAITFLLMKLCDNLDDTLYFDGEVILDKAFVWDSPDGFKFVFEDDKLISINHI